MKIEEIISDEEIERVHANADFGNILKRDVVNYALLKAASGYHNGHTAKTIIIEHGLITHKLNLTKKGKKYLWEAFGRDAHGQSKL